MQNLIEVRCPYNALSKKNGKSYACNKLCVKVAPGSRGEGWCGSCRRSFNFEVDAAGARPDPVLQA